MAGYQHPAKLQKDIFKVSGAGRNGGVLSSQLLILTGTLDDSSLTNEKLSLWEKYGELAKIPSERAKMKPNLLKIVDKVLIKSKKAQDLFFGQVNIKWFLLTGDTMMAFNRHKPWIYREEFGL